MSTSGKKNRGRQKIEMKKMTKNANLQVTFSKRRNGLFKKASELCTLSGAEMALIVLSPGNKVFSFGHPSVEAVIERNLPSTLPQPSDIMPYIQAQRNANVCVLNAQLSDVNNLLDAKRKHGVELNCQRKAAQSQLWWTCPIEEMDKRQLEQFRIALDELKKKVTHYNDILPV